MATEQFARKLESDVELHRRGVIDTRALHAACPLADHLTANRAHLTAKHAGMVWERVRRVVALAKGAALPSIIPPRRTKAADRVAFAERAGGFVQAARLADLTADRIPATLATLRDSGMSLQRSVNHHRAAIRGFSR